jgi:cysteine sulfinate desulfinase/cysteine desulfurase-like protein
LCLPENGLYLIPIDISEERIGDNLCHGTSIGMNHMLMALMVAGFLVGTESRCSTENTKHRHILYSSYPKNTACIQAYYV